MATAGLAVEGIFTIFGIVPESRPETVVETHFQWNYTTFLNIAFLGIFAVLYWLYRHRDRFGGGTGYAIDPVCGMQVQIANAPASATVDGTTHWFCSDHCREHFVAQHAAHGDQDSATRH
jgi:YHS domain-containing protein